MFHCPYCDGWEVRDAAARRLRQRARKGYGLSLELTAWSSDILLCTDGPSELAERQIARLSRNGIIVAEEPCRPARRAVTAFSSGSSSRGRDAAARRALFFTTGQHQQSALATALGCEFNDKGTVHTGQVRDHSPARTLRGRRCVSRRAVGDRRRVRRRRGRLRHQHRSNQRKPEVGPFAATWRSLDPLFGLLDRYQPQIGLCGCPETMDE